MKKLLLALIKRMGFVLVHESALRMADQDKPYFDPAVESEFKAICDRINSNVPSLLDINSTTNYTIYSVLRHIIKNDIRGDIVECGVAAGVKIAICCETLRSANVMNKDLYLYDTFEGMTAPGPKDDFYEGNIGDYVNVKQKWRTLLDDSGNTTWGRHDLDTVRANIEKTKYPLKNVHFVKGDVSETLKDSQHEEIAVLRLDTDFYDSSLVELEELYPKVVPGGVVILDDYGSFRGQRSATDEYLDSMGLSPLLFRTCRQERAFIKLD